MNSGKVCLLVLLTAGLACGQESAGPEPRVLVLHPRREPVPALKYPLLPDVTDLHPGNAALYYHRAMLIRAELHSSQAEQQKLVNWLETPVNELPREEMHTALRRYRNLLHEVDLGARSADMDWGLLFRPEGVDLLLPEVQAMRSLITIVALQARLEIAEGRFADAVHALQTGFAMSRHVGQAARTLVETLVADALANVMEQQVEAFIQVEGAPNLYWSLTQVPRPFVPLRPGLEGDKLWFWNTFPQLRRLEHETLSVAEVNRIADASLRGFAALEDRSENAAGVRLEILALTIKAYPRAKEWLRSQGKTPAQIQAMPALQAVLRYSLFQYHRLQDDLYKWAYLPYWQAEPGLEKVQRELKQAKATLSEGIPFATLLLPAIQRVVAAPARFQQRIAVLRIVEAIRMYAAAHDGQFPAAFDDIHSEPLPLDPLTNKPFRYERKGERALLTASVPPIGPQLVRYELRMAR
ncbi:MAG TPA: hypothetical protein VFA18_11285 [Gemmataceae bacterium]|nr:hypothetical protein [Gemmataceae bacterium]